MLNITRLLAKLLDFPISMTDLIYSEARTKLVSTAVVVNGKLLWLTGIDPYHLVGHDAMESHQYDSTDVENLEVYLPESGMYQVGKDNFRYLQKIAKRQWKKSFSWSYYSLTARVNDNDIFKIYGQKPIQMFQIPNGDIFYRSLKIANKQGLLVPGFENELEQFNKRRVSVS